MLVEIFADAESGGDNAAFKERRSMPLNSSTLVMPSFA